METPEGGVKNLGDSSPLMQSKGYKEVKSIGASVDQSIDVAGICNEAATLDQEDMVIDESNSGEPWVQGLMEGEYSDLSVEERLSAVVALIGVANEGNSIRIILEECLEAANALKKQMWAEVQLDKYRMKEEYVMKIQYPSCISDKTEPNVQISSVEGRQSPLPTVDDKNGLVSTNPVEQKEHLHDAQNDQNYTIHMPTERNPPIQEASTCTDNLSLLQPGYAAERSRSQLKAYIGHKAEEMYVYRSLPLGQDRRRNRYWQFITSSSRNDPGSGRIFVELRHGCWRLIDSEEGFDALLASLDVRGLRESNLHSMLQKVEVSFKETLRRNLAHTKAGRPMNNFKTEVSGMAYSFDCSASSDSPSCTVYVSNSDMPEPSSSFSIGLGRNETEKKDALKRYQDFEKWMWEECLNSSVLYAVKYGKKRCRQLLDVCDCRDVYYFEDDHCPSCHRTYETSIRDINFSEHVAKCKEKFKGDPCWTSQGLDPSPPLRIRLHKALLALIEVSIPIEALQPAWSEGYRRSWGMKLHTVTSAEELLQILTLLEVGIKKDFLSSNFETTNELLGSCNQTEFAANVSLNSELVSVLPWVPQTSSAVALRLMELDASIYYELHQKKIDSQKDKGAGDFIMPPSKFSLVKNVPEYDLAQAPLETENLLQEPWADHGSLHSSSGRGRGARGRGRGGRTRGGRSQRRAISSRSVNAQRSTTTNSERFGQLLGWKGRSRGRGGRKRGRRTARSRQKPVKRVAEIGSERDQPKEVLFENTVRSSDLQWNREEPTGTPLLGAENASSSERSEYEDYNRQAMAEDEYDDDLMVDDYSSVFNGKSMHLMEGIDYNLDGEEDDDDRAQEEGDDDADADGDGDEDEGDDSEEDGQGDTDVERYINDESDEGEEENRDGGGEQIGNTDEGEGTGSTSSEYSDE